MQLLNEELVVAGIRLVNCEDCLVENNTIINSDIGVEINGGANMQVMKNNFLGVQTAIKGRNVEKLVAAENNHTATNEFSDKAWLSTSAEAYSIKKLRGK